MTTHVSERFFVAAAPTLTRPADTTVYPINGAIGDSDTAGSVTPLAFTVSRQNAYPVSLERCRVKLTAASVESVYRGKRIAIDFFSQIPTVIAGDKTAYTVSAAYFIGTMSGAFKQTDAAAAVFSSGATQANLVPDVGSRIICRPSTDSQIIYGLLRMLEATASNVASIAFDVSVEGFQGHA